MKDLNSLESLMGSWKPRGPSARLERRLFSRRQRSEESGGSTTGAALWFSWMPHLRQAVPVGSGALLLFCLVIVGGGWSQGGTASQGIPVLAAMSNQSWTVDLSLVDNGRNAPVAILGWTNREGFPSTNPSLDQLNTNHLWPRL